LNLGTFKIYKAHILCGKYLFSLLRPLHMVICSAVITITCNLHDSGSTHCSAMYCSYIRFLPHTEKLLEMVAFSLQTYITPWQTHSLRIFGLLVNMQTLHPECFQIAFNLGIISTHFILLFASQVMGPLILAAPLAHHTSTITTFLFCGFTFLLSLNQLNQ
jgi:hypothetical protein